MSWAQPPTACESTKITANFARNFYFLTMISFFTQAVRFDLPQKRTIKNWLKSVAEAEGMQAGTLSIIFCSDEELLAINRQYLQHDYYTDVITFDYTEGKTIAGDIFISLDTVRANAVEYQQTFENELRRVMLHGILHLCGHGDNTAHQQKTMRALEDFYLKMIE
jgi:rRNA maturation RNase YbeY